MDRKRLIDPHKELPALHFGEHRNEDVSDLRVYHLGADLFLAGILVTANVSYM